MLSDWHRYGILKHFEIIHTLLICSRRMQQGNNVLVLDDILKSIKMPDFDNEFFRFALTRLIWQVHELNSLVHMSLDRKYLGSREENLRHENEWSLAFDQHLLILLVQIFEHLHWVFSYQRSRKKHIPVNIQKNSVHVFVYL